MRLCKYALFGIIVAPATILSWIDEYETEPANEKERILLKCRNGFVSGADRGRRTPVENRGQLLINDAFESLYQ